MLRKLHVLHLEDIESDSILIERELRKAGLDLQFLWVDTEEKYRKALQDFDPAIILSDYKLPAFDGIAALKIARELRPETPFIFVTGTIGEELAVDSVKQGATDFVVKDRLWRLPLCMSQALELIHERNEHRHLQAQFLQAQKMEVFGQLAGGIAHDFNNLLTIINGYAQLHQADLPENDPVRDTLVQIHQAGERASRLTRQLLAFSRLQVVAPQVIYVNDLITNVQKMLSRLIGENIEIFFRPGNDLWPIKADPGQIEQVLMNLAVNARDAMSGNGKLVIETTNRALGAEYVRAKSEVKPGDYAAIYVSDTGHGMTPDVLGRIFEPFFTTKEPGKGTGLGLATCFGIVKQADGHIEVYSEPGNGTTFKIYLPRFSGEQSCDIVKPAAPKVLTGSETVLVVEDDSMVRGFAVRILKESGYKVLEADHGEKALALLAENPKIDLIMTDVVMPRMNGKEMIERMQKASKNLPKVLFTSGYADGIVTLQGLISADGAFLQKPYAPSVLLQKIRELLDVKVKKM